MDTLQIESNTSLIELLPYDVLLYIFESLSKQDCIRASQTCHAWRQFILRLPKLWRTLSDREWNIGNLNAEYIQASDVRELLLHGEGYTMDGIRSAADFVVRNGYRNIQRALFGKRVIDGHMLRPLVNLFGSNLTSLSLFNDDQPSSTLPYVLNQCPNLSVLDYLATIYPEHPMDLSSLQPHHHLKTLVVAFFSLDPVASYRIYALMRALLHKMPNVEQILMNPEYTNPRQMFHLLRWYTPSLKTIVFSEAYPFERLGRQVDATLNIAKSTSILRSDVLFLLETNCERLKVLDIRGVYQLTANDMIRIVHWHWPALRALHLGPHSDQVLSTSRLSQFLHAAPSLEVIEMVDLLAANDQILAVLSDLHHLVKILFRRLENITCTGLAAFVMNTNSRASLHTLKLILMDAVTKDVFELMGDRLPALKTLDISGLSFSMPLSSLERFISKSVKLHLWDPDRLYDESVKATYRVPLQARPWRLPPGLFDDFPGHKHPGDLSQMPLDINPFMENDVPYLGEQVAGQHDSDHQSDTSFDWFESNDELDLQDNDDQVHFS
ncbi:hypothetical protein BJV82DRAFT_673276 [Fennellomyces sp. T-0311]|nr:hypothetical protein BJV82DRAFT_673276 [Fennellomyces sp. T-0311]